MVPGTANNFRSWLREHSQLGEQSQFSLSASLRAPSLAVLETEAFPTRKAEEWRYTPLKQLLAQSIEPLTGSSIDTDLLEQLKDSLTTAYRLVFIDGQFSSEHSNKLTDDFPAGLNIQLMAELDPESRQRAEATILTSKLSDDNIFQHITRGLSRAGLFIKLDRDIEIDIPIQIVYLSSTNSGVSCSTPINVVCLEENSRLQIVEQFASLKGTQTVTLPAEYIHLKAGAGLVLYKIGLESEATDHISNTSVQVAREASFKSHQYLLGSRLTRSNMEVHFSGPGGEALLRGIYLGDNSQHLDVRTYLDHAQPHCRSDQHFRGIMSGRSRGVFNGMVLVREQAQLTDARQSNKNLLLSRDARVDTKPQLEIYADDVKCAHGATVGELDPDALFYLQTRGISKPDAALMLTRAFAAVITQEIQIDTLRSQVHNEIAQRLNQIETSHV